MQTSTPTLRHWQVQALSQYFKSAPKDFLVTATPGAGKTTFALTLASTLMARRAIDRIVVVVPTDHLRKQWADAAHRAGIALDPTLTNATGPVPASVSGYVTTYAQVASHPMLHRARATAKRTLVILDEVHHAGDGLTWGEAVQVAFAEAQRRLCLTGTPFRTKAGERIPFVSYATDADEMVSVADYSYGYAQALADNVVRPVVFAAYSGTSRWMNSAGEVISASLSESGSRKREDTAWRTALNPEGKWIPHVIAAADQRLSDLRSSAVPDAAALMLATDQETARVYALLVKKVTGHKAVIVVSDDPASSKRIASFNSSNDRWIVAVRQVSEGVDIARLAVCVWTTSYRTPLFFAQAVGRVVRARNAAEAATVFLPAVRPLLALAAQMETERNQAVRIPAQARLDDTLIERIATEPGAPAFTALDSEAEFAHVMQGGRAHTAQPTGPSDADEDFLGLPGLLDAQDTARVLAARDAKIRKSARYDIDVAGSGSDWRDVDMLRKEVAGLVRTWAARSEQTPAMVHVELRKAGPGPPSAAAPAAVLAGRRDYLLARVG